MFSLPKTNDTGGRFCLNQPVRDLGGFQARALVYTQSITGAQAPGDAMHERICESVRATALDNCTYAGSGDILTTPLARHSIRAAGEIRGTS